VNKVDKQISICSIPNTFILDVGSRKKTVARTSEFSISLVLRTQRHHVSL
jgi:hypothetical protein